MQKVYFTAIILVITSCSSSRVCGGSGGKRCVGINKIESQNTITLEKSILS